MTLHLGDEAPNLTAETTDGDIDFHQWKAGSWAVLFSHPADYTPVCTTELGRTAALADGFASRDTKVLALSVDPKGDRVIASPGLSTDEARKRFENLEEVKPYLRYVDDPSAA